jgi:hypothetical protein
MIIESVGECKSFPQHNQADVSILSCPYCRLIRTGSSLAVKRFGPERTVFCAGHKARGARCKEKTNSNHLMP